MVGALAIVGTAIAGTSVGSVASVGLGSAVGLGTEVGTSVGIAACVRATIVLAAATAEACTRDGSTAGAAGAPQALSKKTRTVTIREDRFKVRSPFLREWLNSNSELPEAGVAGTHGPGETAILEYEIRKTNGSALVMQTGPLVTCVGLLGSLISA